MKIITSRFGEIDIDENKIIAFPMGIPGFSDLKRYVLIEYKDPIKWLQAMDDPDVAFIVANPFAIFPDYSVDIQDDMEALLGISEPKDLVVLNILTVRDSGITANLKGPLVMNSANFKAAQILLEDEKYSFRTPLPALPKSVGR